MGILQKFARAFAKNFFVAHGRAISVLAVADEFKTCNAVIGCHDRKSGRHRFVEHKPPDVIARRVDEKIGGAIVVAQFDRVRKGSRITLERFFSSMIAR